jgi:hypothetical protein
MTDLLGILIANTAKASNPGRITSDPRFWCTSLSLLAALLIGAVVFAILDRWRRQPAEDRVSAGDQLSHFRSLYDRGEISREEFERIRARLGGKLRQELQLPQPPAPLPPAHGSEPGGNGAGPGPTA